MNDNKENTPATPQHNPSSAVAVGNSPASMKKTLKPISPNKNSNTYVGKLNFLQSDNFDEHFNHIHSVNEQIQQQLSGVEVQTRQMSADVGQLVDRLKNNNSNLTKVLNQIASYSDDVITEGYETKNQISEIIERLEKFNSIVTDLNTKFPNFEKSIEDVVVKTVMKNTESGSQNLTVTDIADIVKTEVSKFQSDTESTILDAIADSSSSTNDKQLANIFTELKELIETNSRNIDKLVGNEAEAVKFYTRIEELLSKDEHMSETQIRLIFNETFNQQHQLSQEILQNQKNTITISDIKSALSEGLDEHKRVLMSLNESKNQNVDEETIRRIVSQNNEKQTTLVDRILENQKGALNESTARKLIIDNFSEHKSQMQTFWESKISEQLIANVNSLSKSVISNQNHLAKESSVQELLSRSSSVHELTGILVDKNNTMHSEILAKLSAIQEALPEQTLVKQIVEPIVQELSAVSLDSRSQKLLEDIFKMLEKYQERNIQSHEQQLEKNMHIESIGVDVRNFSENIKNVSDSLLDIKDKQIALLQTKLEQQNNIIHDALRCKDLQNKQTELEMKIKGLEEKYNQMTKEYVNQYEELVNLKKEYDDFIQNSGNLNEIEEDYSRTQKVRQLHMNKMRDLQVPKNRQNNSKRIVSSPLLIKE